MAYFNFFPITLLIYPSLPILPYLSYLFPFLILRLLLPLSYLSFLPNLSSYIPSTIFFIIIIIFVFGLPFFSTLPNFSTFFSYLPLSYSIFPSLSYYFFRLRSLCEAGVLLTAKCFKESGVTSSFTDNEVLKDLLLCPAGCSLSCVSL